MPLYTIPSVLSALGGIANGFVCMPIPAITQYLRKQTLWEFENIWLPKTIVAQIILPIVGMFALIPFSQIQDAFENTEFRDWATPVIVAIVWNYLAFIPWGLATDFIGLGLSSSLIFLLFPIADSIIKYIIHEQQWGNVEGILMIVGCVILLLAIFITIVAFVFKEKHTREKRRTRLQNIFDDISREEVRKNKDKKPKNRHVRERTVIFRYYLGFTLSIMSGLCYTLLSCAFEIASKPLFEKFNQRNIDGFRSRILVSSVAFVISSVGGILFSVVLLISKKTIKKYAILSGGFVALDGCTNSKPLRLVCLIIAALMGLFWYVGVLLLFYAESETTKSSWHPLLYSLGTFIVTNIFSIMLFEWKGTQKVEKVLIPIGWIIAFIGYGCVLYGNSIG